MGAHKLADDLAYPPRGMRADRAAAYLGMSRATFLRLVTDRVFPAGIQISGMVVWDRLELDAAFEAIKDKPDPKTGDADKNTMHEILGMNNGDED